MGTEQNTRAYRRRLNVVAAKFRRNPNTEVQQFSEPPVWVKLVARTAMWFRVYWKVALFVLWLATVAAIGVLK